MSVWRSYVPYHVAQDLLERPGLSPVGREQRFEAVVLFADVSGFTALSEALGATGKDGTEQLTEILNDYFGPMISLIESYGGIIGKFGGDAMTVLFPFLEEEASTTARRAIQCALAMQARMGDYAAIRTRAGVYGLSMKAGLAAGSVFCTTIGDPTLRLEYIIAGSALDRCAEAEHHALAGEVVVQDSLLKIAAPVKVGERRDGFSVVRALPGEALTKPLPELPEFSAAAAQIAAAYIHPSIAQRLREGQLSFVNEHRKVTILFINFSGYDYDGDPLAGKKLQEYLLQIIQITSHYDGYLNKVDMGDKGSKCLLLFGAPIAHEDDAERALRCALEIRQTPGCETRIGVNTGFVYCGQVGSENRHEYTVMGDAVNLAARLMQAAGQGQILVGEATYRDASRAFEWGQEQQITVKGKTHPVLAYPLGEIKRGIRLGLQEPRYTLPMVGRQAEMQIIDECLSQGVAGQGQIVGLTAEAGMGKSRLAAEAVKLALQRNYRVFGGECLSHGTNTPYLVWRNLLSGLFGLDSSWPAEVQYNHLEEQLASIHPILAQRLPLLGTALNLPFPENEITRLLDARLRKSSLEDLVITCIRHYSQSGPLLLILEDCHWIDPLSDDLLEVVGRGIVNAAVLILVVYRPPEANRQPPALTGLSHFTEIRLSEFNQQEAAHLISLKLRQLFGTSQDVQEDFVQRITQRAQGNPFYIDEMVNLIHDRGIDPADSQAWRNLDLPDSLHSLIISRIDQLEEATKTTLKVASVIGRSFRASWLWGAYPAVGTPEQVKSHLAQLSRLDITPLDKPEPELEYLFKHIVTREVAYESLALATRTMLHGQVGMFLERTYADDLERYLDLLAYHYGLSQNIAKQREYYRKAGQAAQAAYANEAAVEYYQRLLPLVEGVSRVEVMLSLGEVWQLTGRWSEARDLYQQAIQLASYAGDRHILARCQYAIGALARSEGSFAEALSWLKQAQRGFSAVQDSRGVSEATREIGIIHWSQGNLQEALECFNECLRLATQSGDARGIFRALGNIGLVYKVQGDYAQALSYYERCRQIAEEIGDRLGVSAALGNMGNIYLEEGKIQLALEHHTQNLHIALELGYRFGVSVAIGNLGEIYFLLGDYDRALRCYAYNLRLALELGDRPGVARTLWQLGNTYADLEQFETAEQLLSQAIALGRTLDTPYDLSEYLDSLSALLMQVGKPEAAFSVNAEALALAQAFENREIQFKAHLREMHLLTLEEPDRLPQTIQTLQDLLKSNLEEAKLAAVHEEIWRLDSSQVEHRLLAADAYARLYHESADIHFKRRCEQLSGQDLFAPTAIGILAPPLPKVVSESPIDLNKLLAQVRSLLDEK